MKGKKLISLLTAALMTASLSAGFPALAGAEPAITKLTAVVGNRSFEAEINPLRGVMTINALASEIGAKALEKVKVTYEASGAVTTAVPGKYQDLRAPIVYTVSSGAQSREYTLSVEMSTVSRRYNFNGATLLAADHATKERRQAPGYLSGSGNDGVGMWYNFGYAFDSGGNAIESETFGTVSLVDAGGSRALKLEKTKTGGPLGVISLGGDAALPIASDKFTMALDFRLDSFDGGKIVEFSASDTDRVVLTGEGAPAGSFFIGCRTPQSDNVTLFDGQSFSLGRWYRLTYIFRKYPGTETGYNVEVYIDNTFLGETDGSLSDPAGRLRWGNVGGVYDYTQLRIEGEESAVFSMVTDNFVNTFVGGGETPFDDSDLTYEYDDEEDPEEPEKPESPEYDGIMDYGFEHGGKGWVLDGVNLIRNGSFETDDIWQRGTTDAAGVSYVTNKAYSGERSAYFVFDDGVTSKRQAAWRDYSTYAISPNATYQLGMAVIVNGLSLASDSNIQLSFRTSTAAGVTVLNENGGYCARGVDTDTWVYLNDDYQTNAAEARITQLAARINGVSGITAYVDDLYFGAVRRVETVGDTTFGAAVGSSRIYSGTSALKVGGYGGIHGDDAVKSEPFAVTPMATYRVGAFAKSLAPSTVSGRVGLIYYDAAGAVLKTDYSAPAQGGDYSALSRLSTAPAAAETAAISLFADGAGNVMFDNVSFEKQISVVSALEGAADRTLVIPENGEKTVDLGITVLDQFGMPMSGEGVTLTADGSLDGVRIGGGALTVAANAADGGALTVTATAIGDSTVNASFTVHLRRLTFHIAGPASVTRKSGVTEADFPASLIAADGEKTTLTAADAIWSLTDYIGGEMNFEEGGRLSISPKAPLGGYTLRVTLKSDPTAYSERGFTLAKETAAGGGSGSVKGSGGSIISPAASVTPVSPVKKPPAFTDVTPAHWAYDAVRALAEAGYVSGLGDGAFGVENPVTRAEFLKMLMNALQIRISAGETAFADVAPEAWYGGYVSTAVELGLVQGYSDTLFGANDQISREDLAVILLQAIRYKRISLPAEEKTAFSDAAEIAGYAREAVAALLSAGLVRGFADGRFAPKSGATRGETAQILYALVGGL